MPKYNLDDYNKKIVEKIRTEKSQIKLFIEYCNKLGVDPQKAIENAKVAKSTKENWSKKQPKQFDNLAKMYKSADELKDLQKEIDKLKKKYGNE